MTEVTAPARKRRTPAEAEAAFRARVAELGGVVVGEYAGMNVPVEVTCREGHTGFPRPNGVKHGQGLCRTCAGNDPATAEAAFHARVTELGGLVVGTYAGKGTPVEVTCRKGHTRFPRPNDLQQGDGICRVCAGMDPAAAEAAFRARVGALGGVVVGPYVNDRTPVEVLCREGHAGFPNPTGIKQGQGICRVCKGMAWNAFYVVQSPDDDSIKFGVTSGDPRPRLRVHARDGYTDVLRLHAGLPGTVAPDLERNIKAALKDARVAPIRGREYFPESVLPLILDLVDHHPDVALTPATS